MDTTRSADGTTIAYDRYGSGTPLILVNGALSDRSGSQPLAEALAPDFTVISYDRRGRGDSGDTSPYSVAREIQDLRALIDAVGGSAAVYGHSSGAALTAIAASSLPITSVVLHEPPYGPDDEESQQQSDDDGAVVLRLLREGRRTDAVATFLAMAGMPSDAATEYARTPGMAEVAHTLAYDFAVMDHASKGGVVPISLLEGLQQPTLVVAGSASPPFMVDAARSVAKTVQNGRLVELDGQHHVVPAEVLAPVLRAFLS
ncbi:alpha/beta fold hydrolase [Kribbella sp. NPDC051620]|uniref:alpha/beta fold hydrolase n=1 Tax=Kribbella sp. NPDC051620 TaxID=3364120 RepID=UPI00378976A5